MKVSEWLRQYQLTGLVPETTEPPELAFWCGWLLGPDANNRIELPAVASRIEAAIECAEFIEEHGK